MFRRKKKNFRETLEYISASFFETEGYFLPYMVSLKFLPEDINVYYISRGRDGRIDSLDLRENHKASGIYFTKDLLPCRIGNMQINEDRDVIMAGKMESTDEFIDFFNVKLALDKQIQIAQIQARGNK